MLKSSNNLSIGSDFCCRNLYSWLKIFTWRLPRVTTSAVKLFWMNESHHVAIASNQINRNTETNSWTNEWIKFKNEWMRLWYTQYTANKNLRLKIIYNFIFDRNVSEYGWILAAKISLFGVLYCVVGHN